MVVERPDFNITQFVRGMAWHDIAKPFALRTDRHAALGYWLLNLAGYPGEALVALAHGNTSKRDILTRYFTSGGVSLPGILSLCNPLDQLAASVYSMQSKGENTDRHSYQNPFSRLPIPGPLNDERFNISHQDLQSKFELPLWAQLRAKLPPEWQSILTDQIKATIENKQEPLVISDPLSAGKDALKVLLNYMTYYPERTYPSVNDTSLAQHCRLSGILAYIVYRNIERENNNWLASSITFVNNKLVYPIENSEAVIRQHLVANLVRVAFEGHRYLYEHSVRVDDLHGARELTNVTRERFRQALATELGAPELAEFLTISESQFDLIYLLPPANEPLADIIDRAYESALEDVTTDMLRQLGRDFPQIADQKIELRRQLGGLIYGLRVISIPTPKKSIVDFGQFAAEYGHTLLQAYQQSLKYVRFPGSSLPNKFNQAVDIAPLAAANTCQVCGNHPILTPSDHLGEEEKNEWQTRRNFAAHIFRGEREQICLFCVARRTLAYGAIAKNKELHHTVHPIFKPSESGSDVWIAVPTAERDGPPLPPLLTSAVQLTGKDEELINLEAFYVRYRRKGGQVMRSELDIFPTTTYAADANGNIILLALQPTEALFATYVYDDALEQISQLAEESQLERKLWLETFVNYYKTVKDHRGDNMAESIRHVQPHLARVMGRIEWIKQFYQTLWERMNEAKLRVLPLNLEYPTLRLLLSAEDLDRVLRILNRVLTETLFSATFHEDEAEQQEIHKVLALLTPDLLHAAAILLKHKYPLYLALEAERGLFQQLQDTDPRDDATQHRRPGNGQWYGLRLAFSDLRGTLSQVGPKLAEVAYADLGPVLHLTEKLDRRLVTGRANIINSVPANHQVRPALIRLADALTTIRANRLKQMKWAKEILATGKPQEADKPDELKIEENPKFAPVHFIKTAIRE